MVSGHTLNYNENRDSLVLIRDGIVLQIRQLSLYGISGADCTSILSLIVCDIVCDTI